MTHQARLRLDSQNQARGEAYNICARQFGNL